MPQDLDRINASVRECLSRCYANPDEVVITVAAYLDELRAAGWGDTDVCLIRATVAKFLRQMAGQIDGDENP